MLIERIDNYIASHSAYYRSLKQLATDVFVGLMIIFGLTGVSFGFVQLVS